MTTRIKTIIHFGLSWSLAITLIAWVSATLPVRERSAQLAGNPAVHAFEQFKHKGGAIFTHTALAHWEMAHK